MDKNINIKITTKADSKAINTVADRVKTLGNNTKSTASSIDKMDNSVGSFVKRNNSLKNTAKEFDNIDNSVRKNAKSMSDFERKILNAGKAVGSIYVLKQGFDVAFASASKLLSVAGQFETKLSILETLEGSSVKAQKSFEWIKRFTAETPNQLSIVTSAFLTAKSYGIDPVNGSLKSLGDAASGMGKDLTQAVEAVADAMVGENERLKEFGIKASVQGEKIGYSWTSASGKAKHIVIENNSEIIQSTVQAIFNSKYEGAMQKQMNTWLGITSNFADNYTNFIDDIAKRSGLFSAFKLTVKDLNKEFESLLKNEKDMDLIGEAIRGSMLMGATAVDFFAGVTIGTFKGFAQIGTIWDQIGNNIKLVFAELTRAWNETVYAWVSSGNKVLPDFMKNTLGFSDKNVKEALSRFDNAKQEILNTKDEISNRLNQYNDYAAGLDLVRDKISLGVDKFKEYTSTIKENTKAKDENSTKKTDFGNDGKLDFGNDATTKIKQQQDAYNGFIQITGSEYEKWLNSTNQKMVSLANSGVLTAQQLQAAWNSMQNEYEINLKIKQIDQDSMEYESMLEGQLALIDSTNAWGNSLDGVAGSIANLSGAFSEMSTLNIEETLAQREIDDEYKKAKIKYANDELKIENAKQKWQKKTNTLKKKSFKADLEGYSNVAGAAAAMFDQNSKGYKAITLLQIGLQMAINARALSEAMSASTSIAASSAITAAKMTEAGANATASVTAAGSGDPYTAAARVLTMMALMTAAFSMFSGGGGSGSSSVASMSNLEYDTTMATYEGELVIDKLDRQIELLKIIGENGTADRLQLKALDAQFNMDKTVFLNELVAEMPKTASLGKNYTDAQWEMRISQYESINKELGFALYSWDESKGTINTDTGLYQNPMDVMLKLYEEGLTYNLQDLGVLENTTDDAYKNSKLLEAEALKKISNLQQYTADYVLGLGDLADNMVDAKETMEDAYDSITGTSTYASKKLEKDFNRVFNSMNISTPEGLADFLEDAIEDIEKFDSIFTNSVKEIFLSQDPADLEKQASELKRINKELDNVYLNSTEEALNYIDSIEAVAEEIAKSRENIKSWNNSFKTDMRLAQDLASSVDITYLAKDLEELNSLFINLKDSTYGLTDAGLELLQANKSLIEDYTDIIKEIDNIINPKTLTLDSITVKDASLDTAEDILDSLKEAKQAEIDRITEENNNRKTELQERQKQLKEEQKTAQNLVKAFENTTKSLNSTYRDIMGLSENADSFTVAEYNRLYKEIKDGIENKADVSSLTSDFSKYATSYAEYIKEDSKTAEEYERRLKTLANSVKDLAGRSESATLNDLNKSLESSTLVLNSIDKQIAALDINLQTAIHSVNSTYTQQMQALKNALENSFKNNTAEQNESLTTNYTLTVENAYKNVLGRQADKEGLQYWATELLNKKIKETELNEHIAKAAVNFNLKDYQEQTGDYSKETAQLLLNSIANAKKYLIENSIPFANGGIVQGGRGGVIGHIGEKDYSELIVPLDGRDFFGLEELKDLIRDQNEVIQDNISRTTIINTTSYIKEEKAQKENDVLEKIVAELRRLNIISSKHAEATKKVLKTQKQNLLKDLQEGA